MSGSYSRTRELAERNRIAAAARRIRNRRLRFAGLLTACVMTGLLIGLFTPASIRPHAAADHPVQMRYRSVCMRSGDTLDGIEREYNTENQLERAEYISLVKSINHINDNDTVHAGAYLTVPYYENVY